MKVVARTYHGPTTLLGDGNTPDFSRTRTQAPWSFAAADLDPFPVINRNYTWNTFLGSQVLLAEHPAWDPYHNSPPAINVEPTFSVQFLGSQGQTGTASRKIL